METNQIKIRINLDQREFEIEGEIKFIDENFGPYIKECLDIIKSTPTKENSDSSNSDGYAEDVSTVKQESEIPNSFGEYLNKFPKTINNVDRILLAGYFLQMHSESKSFTVVEASNLLIEQGVKLSNASVFNKSNKDSKKIFILSGKNFRVSDAGVEYIKTIA